MSVLSPASPGVQAPLVSAPAVPAAALPHPGVWRASRLGASSGPCVDTGHAALSAELPGRGWPRGQLIELLVARAGVGEIRLLQPALSRLAGRRPVALVQPPHPPHAASWAAWQLDPARLLWVQPGSAADALWAADQILKNGSCAALLCWLPRVRHADLRRLHLSAQASDTLFVGIRPLAAAQQSSPAPLRLIVHPAPGGVLLRIVKRRGPARDLPLHVAWPAIAAAPAVPANRDAVALSARPPSLVPGAVFSGPSHVSLDRHLPASAHPGRAGLGAAALGR